MTPRLRQRWLLAVLVAGQFMANVDIAIVNVATPSIHRDPQYLQQGLGRSATYSGLVLVSWVAAFGIAAPVTRRLRPGRLRSAGCSDR